MSQIQKAIARLTSRPCPKDFRWQELVKVMSHVGFLEVQGDGSRVKFYSPDSGLVVDLHKRHPDDTLLEYQVKKMVRFLTEQRLLKK